MMDSTGHGVGNVTVTYGEKGKTNILGFAISDSKGLYEIQLKTSTADSLWLKVNHISFQPRTLIIANKSATHNFRLSTRTEQLEEVVTKSYQGPITRRGDTLNYNVDSFAARQDRSIGDIIKKLPGVEMNGDQILYNGKPLNKYTIDKLNLMGGRYGIINDALPFDAIAKVQIIENDQPIKVLDSLVPSEQASLNLVLKKHNITSGSGRVGAGLTPTLWDVNITPITLMTGWQMLNTLQANNTGTSLLGKMGMLTSEDNPGNNATQQYLNVQFAGTPPFDQSKWFENDSKLLSSNFTFKDKNNVEWRGNASYVNQFSKNESYTVTNYLTTNQNITVSDQVRNRYNTNDLNANFTAEKNEKSLYLKESFFIGKKWDNTSGLDTRNDTSGIDQALSTQSFFLANILKLDTKWGKQLISVSSNISYGESPQYLNITPGQFVNILNDSMPYTNAFQEVKYRKFQASNSIGFGKRLGGYFNLGMNAGFSYNSEILQSTLQVDGQALGSNFINNVQFLHPRLYATPNISFEKNKTMLSVGLPLQWQQFRADYGRQSADSTTMSKLTLNPSLNVKYTADSKWEFYTGGSYGNNFGRLSGLYQSYIMGSFSSLSRAGAYQVSQSRSWRANASANYRDVLASRFGRISVYYAKNHDNYISQTLLDDYGLSYQQLVAMGNGSRSYGVNGNISQYFSRAKTIVKLSARWSKSISDQLVNEVFAPYTSESYGGSVNIDNTLLKWVSFSYNGSYGFSKNYYPGRKLNDVTNQTHHLEVNLFPHDGHMLSAYADYYISNLKTQTDQVFLNLKYTFSIPAHKLDFSVTCNNILNTRRYISQYNSTYSLVYRELYLRPRQLLASVRFNFGPSNDKNKTK